MAGQQSSLKSVFLLSLCSFGHLAIQFALITLLAKLFGANDDFQAYSAARAVPLVISGILIGSLNFAFVPVFMERREKEGEGAAWKTAGVVGGWLLLLTTVVAVICFLAAEPIIARLNPSFGGETLALAVRLFRVLIWISVTNGIISFLQAVHHCQQRFLLPAIASPLGGVVAIAVTLLFYKQFGIEAVAYGIVTGACLATLLQMPFFLRNARLRLTFDEGLRRILALMAPLIAGAAYFKLDPLVDRYLVPSSLGNISYLEYSWYFTSAMLTLTTSGLAVVVFPVIAQRSAQGDREGLKLELAYAMRFLAFVLTPSVMGLLLFCNSVIGDILQRGEFTAADTQTVSLLIKIYTIVVIGGSFGEVLSRVFYALKDTRTPVKIAVVGFTLGLATKIAVAPHWNVVGIAAATSTYYLFNAVCMLFVLRRKIQGIGFAGVLRTVRDCLLGSAVASAVAFGVIAMEFPFSSIPAAILAAGSYAGVMYWLDNEFAVKFFTYLGGQWNSFRHGGNTADTHEHNA